MAYKLISVKCPDCGQILSVEENRQQAFCTYCGAKVLISNENEYIIRQIDEAGIQQAETDRIVKLRLLEQEEKENKRHRTLVIIWVISTIALTVVGIVGLATDNDNLGICFLYAMLFGMLGWIGLFEERKKRKRKLMTSDEAMISSEMTNHTDKHYLAIDALFKGAGFRNVTLVPLHDLSFLSFGRDGKVQDVTVEGKTDFEEGDIFSRNAPVTITYHSKK